MLSCTQIRYVFTGKYSWDSECGRESLYIIAIVTFVLVLLQPNERQSSRTSAKNYKEESGSEVDDEEEVFSNFYTIILRLASSATVVALIKR